MSMKRCFKIKDKIKKNILSKYFFDKSESQPYKSWMGTV